MNLLTRNEPPPGGIERAAPPVLDHLRSLRCLAAVARHGSAVRAAEAIHLSQPAVTRAILDFEKFCNLQLFERASRGMVPTAAGTTVARRAEVLLQQLEKGAAEAIAIAAPQERRSAPERFASAVPAASLKALAMVASCTSEARAAQLLGLSQPAVHRALRALEHLAGTTLFQKSTRGTWLTRPGEALLRRVKLALAEARAMEGDISAWRGEIRGRVVVGALPLSVSIILPRAVDGVLQRHQDVEITIIDGTYESLMEQLLAADVDVIVGALRPGTMPQEVAQEKLFEDDLAVVARTGHPCLSSQPVTLENLLHWPWISPLQGTPASAALERVFAVQGLPPPRATLQATSPSLTRSLILCADRLALMSRGEALIEERRGLVRIVPVALPVTTRPIGMAVRSMGEPSPDLRVLLEELRRAASNLA